MLGQNFYWRKQYIIFISLSIVNFTDNQLEKKEAVLVFSNLGISRSAAVVMAYLIHTRKISAQVRICFGIIYAWHTMLGLFAGHLNIEWIIPFLWAS